ncbi:gamma-glutamyl-gamma-aminobutyrate hydrolase family protein [Burkholderia glumae]|uniref:Gamma-glutamyl-gamma-aminobutyrate hydrolase family protein n=2 Tax=Burkholderia glumae TaxID=337 RepID=A0AAP9Y3U5_BURGL|nr:gamma-glutamyl-gamma-aminobutyrate hydrolase family protein [Burkholderia glumae]QQM91448.1 gamma-glutamyl-gamma-aminobutyrate hydrolase family protein [Burkholderia glumae]
MTMTISHARAIRPLVGVSCCTREISGAIFHTVLQKYLIALSEYSRCDTVLIPALGGRDGAHATDLRHLIARLDGVLLTGGRSMVEPKHYGGPSDGPDTLHDPGRDATTIQVARLAVEMSVPLFGICRGLQEICCAFGGTLDQDLSADREKLNHRAPVNVSYRDKYLPAHWVESAPGSMLASMASKSIGALRFQVNSLHQQGIRTLGTGLSAAAYADDGVIEAVEVNISTAFALAVQWHPEWNLEANPVNRAMFDAFGSACKSRLGATMQLRDLVPAGPLRPQVQKEARPLNR